MLGINQTGRTENFLQYPPKRRTKWKWNEKQDQNNVKFDNVNENGIQTWGPMVRQENVDQKYETNMLFIL